MSRDREVTEVIATLLDIDVGELTGTTPLAGVGGWDSINALRVLMYLEESIGTALDYERFQAAVTVADLIAVAEQAAAGSGAALWGTQSWQPMC